MSLTYYERPLIIAYSGGKDSDVLLDLALKANVPIEIQHSHTTVDAPETVQHIRKRFYGLELLGFKPEVTYPAYKGQRISMWTLIPMKLVPPTRIARYCCEILKESYGTKRMIATGVRWGESTQRSARGIYEDIRKRKGDKIVLTHDNDDKRQLIERCTLKAKTVANPIIDWAHQDIWGYIHSEKLPVNPLYQCNFSRVGCIGCPLAADKRWTEFRRYPEYMEAYIRAFDRMVAYRISAGKETTWKNGHEAFEWWMEERQIEGQMKLEALQGNA